MALGPGFERADERIDDDEGVGRVLADAFVRALVVVLEDANVGLGWFVQKTEAVESGVRSVAFCVESHGIDGLAYVVWVFVPVDLSRVFSGGGMVVAVLGARRSVHTEEDSNSVFLSPREGLVYVFQSPGRVVFGSDVVIEVSVCCASLCVVNLENLH